MSISNQLNSGSSAQLLGTDGPIARVLERFTPRVGQQRMAALVEAALLEKSSIVVEAPSGAGKTFAYLVPVIAHNKKVIISTATRQLQNQLYQQDIPLVQAALGSSRAVAVLKGRRNYFCPYYAEKYLHSEGLLPAALRAPMTVLWQRFRASQHGELNRLLGKESSSLVPYATSSSEDCLGQGCPHYQRCPLIQARRRAQLADIVVVNHSLFFSDQVMRKEHFGELLPSVDAIVIDEAHRLAEFGQTIVGARLTSRQLDSFCRDAIDTLQRVAPELRQVRGFLHKLEHVLLKLRRFAPSIQGRESEQHIAVVDQLLKGFSSLASWFGEFAERDLELAELLIRTQLIVQKLSRIKHNEGLCRLQPSGRGFILKNVPIDLSSQVRELFLETNGSWIFTSATLSVGEKADRFKGALGLQELPFERVDSEINYRENARLYTPVLPVDPDHPDYSEHLVEKLIPLLELIEGRALILFTSHSALKRVASLLRMQDKYTLFVQEADKNALDNTRLVQQFKGCGRGVLLGTGSFWEGLDLAGIPLSCVVIDKLPFASPQDPLIKLRGQELLKYGVDSFQHYLLPDAVIRLRQGCGRLLRRVSDKGVIMLADPRLHNKSYGSVFVESLPAMQRANELEPLQHFLSNTRFSDPDMQEDKQEDTL